MQRMKKGWLFALVCLMIITLVACSGGNPSSSNPGGSSESAASLPDALVISSGPSGGSWYTEGIVMADVLTRNGVKTSNVAGGGQANFIAVGDGQADLGLTTTDMFDEAHAGNDPFTREYKDVVMLMRQDSTFAVIVVPADSDIHTLADLEGKKIATPNPGTSSGVTMDKLFAVAGLTGKVNMVPGTTGESLALLQDRLVEGVCTALGKGNATLTELATSMELRFIPIEGQTLTDFCALSNGFNEGAIPAGAYPGIEADIPTMVYDSCVIVNEAMSEETAYWITKTLVENWEEQVASCSWLGEVTVEYMAITAGLPMHPGAQRYFDEVLG